MEHQNPERLLRLPEVLVRTGLGRSTIYKLMNEGVFPQSIRIRGTRLKAWTEKSINLWLSSLLPKDQSQVAK
jgi:prophage regulatory protein